MCFEYDNVKSDDQGTADRERYRSVHMLRRSIQRFKENVALSDLGMIAAECPSLHDELSSLAGLLEIGDMLNRRTNTADDD